MIDLLQQELKLTAVDQIRDNIFISNCSLVDLVTVVQIGIGTQHCESDFFLNFDFQRLSGTNSTNLDLNSDPLRSESLPGPAAA